MRRSARQTLIIGVVSGVVAIFLVKSAVFVLLTSFKGLVVLVAVVVLYVFLRGPRQER